MAAESKQLGSAFDLVGKSVEIVKRNWVAFAVTNALTILGALVSIKTDDENKNNFLMTPGTPFSFFYDMNDAAAATGLLAVLLLIAVSIYLYTMLTILQVRSARGENPEVSELAQEAKKYVFRMVGLGFISVFIILVGLLLLIVPGVIAFGRLVMAPYLMVDKDLGIEEAIKQSNQMGKKYAGKVWAAIGVVILIAIGTAIIGGIPLIGALVGTLIAIACSLVIPLRYQQLTKHKIA